MEIEMKQSPCLPREALSIFRVRYDEEGLAYMELDPNEIYGHIYHVFVALKRTC